MAKKVTRPTIKVQPVYSGGADMREVFISLLVDAVRHPYLLPLRRLHRGAVFPGKSAETSLSKEGGGQ